MLVRKGNENAGKHYYYNGSKWLLGQEKTKINQAPLFDLYDDTGISFTDSTKYNTSTFSGNKVFSYKQGTGANDVELGFPITYRALVNVGDITFNFDLLTEMFTYQSGVDIFTEKTDGGFLRKYNSLNNFTYKNGWEKASRLSTQRVIRQYDIEGEVSQLEIDVYDNAGDLNDLDCSILLNNKHYFDYTISPKIKKQ